MRLFIFLAFLLMMTACRDTNDKTNISAGNANRAGNVGNIAGNPNNSTAPTSGKIPEYTYEIVKSYPHDGGAFTQGLEFHDGVFYEGTGGRGTDAFHSSLRKVEPTTGRVLQKIDLPQQYFGEGITVFGDKIYQITWQEKTAFVYNLSDFKQIKQLSYAGEGWGLTHDDTNLIMSDGTHIIRFLDPETFSPVRTITVLDEKGKPVMKINELEYIKGEIWANIWETGDIVRIDPSSGKLLGRINFDKLMDDEMDKGKDVDVLNGIAYDAAGDRIFITGKKWKTLFEIKVVPKS